MQMALISPSRPCRVPFTSRYYVRKPIGSNARWRSIGVVSCSLKERGQDEVKEAAWKGAATAVFAGLMLVHGSPAMAAVPKPPSSYESSVKRQQEFEAAFEQRSGGLSLFDRFKKRAAQIPEEVSQAVEQPAKEVAKVAEKAPTPDFGKTAVADKPQLEAPPPTEVDEKLPKLQLSDKPNQLPEQPKPEPAPKQLPEDSAGGKTQTPKPSRGFLGFLGGGDSDGNSAEQAAGTVAKAAEDAGEAVAQSNPVDAVARAGDKIETQNPSGGFLGFLGGGNSNNPAEQAAGSIAKAAEGAGEAVAQANPVDTVASASDAVTQADPVDAVAAASEGARQAASDVAQGVASAVGEAKEGQSSGGIFSFLGGSNSNAVAEKPQLEIPPPMEVEETLPESAPNDPNVLPEQPKPEPESKQLPQDSPGGETGETKSGGGFLDFFGGSNSQSSVPQGNDDNVVASAADDVKVGVSQAAVSFSPAALKDHFGAATSDAASSQNGPASLVAATFGGSEAKAAEEGFKVGEQSAEPAKDNIQATVYGLGGVFLLAIGLFTLQGNAAGGSHKEH